MNAIDVSVIVTTKNEEKNIANCLNSINPINPTSWEEKGNLVNFGALTMHIIWFIFNTGGGRYEEVKYYLA